MTDHYTRGALYNKNMLPLTDNTQKHHMGHTDSFVCLIVSVENAVSRIFSQTTAFLISQELCHHE